MMIELPLRPGRARPARCCIGSGRLFGFFCRCSSSFSVSSTCSRRDLRLVAARGRAARPGSVRATLALALLGLALAGQQRIDEHPGDAADGDRDQDEQRERLHRHGASVSFRSGSPATSAASSAAASRFSSP